MLRRQSSCAHSECVLARIIRKKKKKKRTFVEFYIIMKKVRGFRDLTAGIFYTVRHKSSRAHCRVPLLCRRGNYGKPSRKYFTNIKRRNNKTRLCLSVDVRVIIKIKQPLRKTRIFHYRLRPGRAFENDERKRVRDKKNGFSFKKKKKTPP